MPEIFKADFVLRKILTNVQRTEDRELQTSTLVLGNAIVEIRVKGEPHYFKNFVPGSLITITFMQSQVTLEVFGEEEETEEEAVRKQSEEVGDL